MTVALYILQALGQILVYQLNLDKAEYKLSSTLFVLQSGEK